MELDKRQLEEKVLELEQKLEDALTHLKELEQYNDDKFEKLENAFYQSTGRETGNAMDQIPYVEGSTYRTFMSGDKCKLEVNFEKNPSERVVEILKNEYFVYHKETQSWIANDKKNRIELVKTITGNRMRGGSDG